tara:strand:- start:676 stop:1086 length:411 start_codon:yes stop_codon:yes gene_type:complete
MSKVEIGKGKEKRKVPRTYVPRGLTKEDRKKQVDSILKGKPRPKVESFKSKRSKHVVAFEKKYGTKITDKQFIYKNIITKKGVDLILDRGRAAFFSSGSRPNQTPASWSNARLASVIMGGAARRVDKAIWDKYKKI